MTRTDQPPTWIKVTLPLLAAIAILVVLATRNCESGGGVPVVEVMK